ncbi:MAG TPA: hypothetical protein VFK05_29615 [Polyangiaceae bacterium]|nr:hypothetical protein [Polyangiaceae bacterium]
MLEGYARETMKTTEELSRRQWLQSVLALGTLGGCSGWRVGSGNPRFSDEERFAPATVSALKAKTTVFVLQPGDGGELDAFRSLLPQAWTMTPLEVVMPDQVDRFKDSKRYQYFTVDTFYSTNGLPEQYGLVLVDALGESDNLQGYCRYPLSKVLERRVSHFEREAVGPKARQYYNWHPSTLALYLRSIQRDLESGLRRSMYEQKSERTRLPSVKEHTLYVPDYALTPDKGSPELQNANPSEVFAQYPYHYEVIEPRALGDLLGPEFAGERSSVLALDCAFTGKERFVTVYSPAGGVIYRRNSRFGATLTRGDIAELLKSVGA